MTKIVLRAGIIGFMGTIHAAFYWGEACLFLAILGMTEPEYAMDGRKDLSFGRPM